MRSVHNTATTVQPAILASRPVPELGRRHRLVMQSARAQARVASAHPSKARAGSSGVHCPASRPQAQAAASPPSLNGAAHGSRATREIRTLSRCCRAVCAGPHCRYTAGGRSHADVDVLMSGPPHSVLREDAHASRLRPKPQTRIRRSPESSSLTAGAPRRPTPASPTHRLASLSPSLCPYPPHRRSLRMRTTPRPPLTIAVSSSSPMSLTLGIAPIDHIQDREKRKGLHDILCPNRG